MNGTVLNPPSTCSTPFLSEPGSLSPVHEAIDLLTEDRRSTNPSRHLLLMEARGEIRFHKNQHLLEATYTVFKSPIE